MTRLIDTTPHPAERTQHYEDVLVPVHPALGHYLLTLVVRDLESLQGKASAEYQEYVASFALFLRDLLPEEFRIPIPAIGGATVPVESARSAA